MVNPHLPTQHWPGQAWSQETQDSHELVAHEPEHQHHDHTVTRILLAACAAAIVMAATAAFLYTQRPMQMAATRTAPPVTVTASPPPVAAPAPPPTTPAAPVPTQTAVIDPYDRFLDTLHKEGWGPIKSGTDRADIENEAQEQCTYLQTHPGSTVNDAADVMHAGDYGYATAVEYCREFVTAAVQAYCPQKLTSHA